MFDAFTTPAEVEQWWGAGEFTTTFTNELRAGGAWRADFTGDEGESSVFGQYRTIERPGVLEMTYQFSWDPDQPPILARFEFSADGSATQTLLTQSGEITDDLRADPEGGWSVTLDFLRRYLAA